MKTLVITVLATVFCLQVFCQPAERRTSRSEYIEIWKDEAIRQMLEYGVPASITLAQGILESSDGNSPLAKYANNHFGIKCHEWTGPTFHQDDDAANECFRKYASAEDSFRDHSIFLKTRSRYASLFDLKIIDYKSWAKGLKAAGYATNPRYAQMLIKLIEENQLHHYDIVGKIPKYRPSSKQKKEKRLKKKKRHKVRVHYNKLKYVVVKDGDTFFRLAHEFDLSLRQIYKYNDLNRWDSLHPGDVFYLEPKRNGSKVHWHEVKQGDTMRSISQLYGVKLTKLYKKNNMRVGTEPNEGVKLSLHKKIKPEEDLLR